MIEKQIKDDYRLGKRKGITELEDFFYMPVRITGSGLNIRQADGQIIVADRQTGDFFNEAFIDHCKSLPIIVEHPVDENNEKDMLHTDSLASNQIVGNTIDAWIENDSEIWGLARLYDKTILDKIEKGEIQSTSPGVRIFFDEKSDPDFKREIPYGINHLAFCERGHWDKPDGKAFDNSKKNKIDLTFNKELCILDKTEESEVSQMQAEKANDLLDNIGIGNKSADSEDKVAEVAEKQDEAKTDEPKKANDSEKADEKADEPKDEKDSKEGEKANDAGVDLSNAASLMAKASHAGVISKDKEDTVAEVTPKQEKEEKVEEKVEKQDEAPTKEDSKKADDSECIDSADETEDDKKRESELKEMRKVCDSADANLGVKMPYISGRQTYRSIAHKFIQSNKQFLDKKYANLALDSYTPELAEEVLKSVYANIAAKSSKPKEVRVGNYVEVNGVLCDPNF